MDATKVLDKDHVRFKWVDAGHELPVTKSEEIVGFIWDFWQG